MVNKDSSSNLNILRGEVALKSKADVRTQEKISWWNTVAEIVVIVVAFVLFNAFLDRIGFITSFDRPLRFVPVLAAEFQVQLPLLNLFWAFTLALSFYKLQVLRWSPSMRLADLALTVMGIYVLYRLLVGGPILDLRPAIDALPGLSTIHVMGLNDVSFIANSVLKLIIGISLVANAFSAVGKLYHIVLEEVTPGRSI